MSVSPDSISLREKKCGIHEDTYLAVLGENARSNLRVLLDELEDGVAHDLRSGAGEIHQGLEPGIGLAEHPVAVAGHDLARFQRLPEVLLDVLVGELVTDLGAHVEDPAEHFLGGQAVEGAGQAEQTGGVTEVGVAEGAADEVGGVGGDVAALVVAVQGEVQAEDVVEALVLLAALAEEDGEVVGPILGGVELLGADGVDLVGAEDQGGHARDLREEGNAVVEGGLPVVGLVHALGVLFRKRGLGVEGGDGDGELGHGVHVAGEGLDHGQDVLGEMRLLGEFAREGADLGGGGHLAGEQQPEHGLGEHLGAGGALGQFLLAVLDGAAVEADALVGVEDGALPDHGLEAAHAANGTGDGDIANLLLAVFLQLLEEGALGGDDLLQHALELGLGGGGICA